MSVVVYSDGVMAADSRAYGGSGEGSPGEKRKIHRLQDGSAVGIVTAVLGDAERFVEWLRAGANPSDWKGDQPDLRALLVKPGGAAYLYESSLCPSGPIDCRQYAIGSGAPYAKGALSMGADAVQAVHVAIAHDSHSGGRVRVLSVR